MGDIKVVVSGCLVLVLVLSAVSKVFFAYSFFESLFASSSGILCGVAIVKLAASTLKDRSPTHLARVVPASAHSDAATTTDLDQVL